MIQQNLSFYVFTSGSTSPSGRCQSQATQTNGSLDVEFRCQINHCFTVPMHSIPFNDIIAQLCDEKQIFFTLIIFQSASHPVHFRTKGKIARLATVRGG